MVEENHLGASRSTHSDSQMLYKEGNRPYGRREHVDRHAMVAVDESRTRGIIDMPTAVPDPPRIGGVKEAPKTGKGRP